MIKQKLLYKTLYIVDVARVSQLMARRMYGIGSRTTEKLRAHQAEQAVRYGNLQSTTYVVIWKINDKQN